MMTEFISWIAVAIALYGTYLNANMYKRGFYFWLVSNSILCTINLYNGSIAQGCLFGIYIVMAMIGIRNWKD